MNLFALELGAILESHQSTMSVLYSLRAADGSPVITPAKVSRMQRALTEDVAATLSEPEMRALADAFGLSSHEEQRLRAAQTGEVIRRILTGRVGEMSALEEGARVVRLITEEEEQADSLRAEVMRSAKNARGADRPPTADVNAAVAVALESAAEACELGELWLSLALSTTDSDLREDVLRMALSSLSRAAQYLACAPTVAQGSTIQQEWRRTMEHALATVRQFAPYD